MGYLRSLRSQLHALTALAVVGLASFAPFLLAPVVAGITTVDWLGWAACVALGLATASCTIVWSVISSDPLCDGSASTGVISGAVNTLCIAYDAAIQQCTGARTSEGDAPKVYQVHTEGVHTTTPAWVAAKEDPGESFGIPVGTTITVFVSAAAAIFLISIFFLCSSFRDENCV